MNIFTQEGQTNSAIYNAYSIIQYDKYAWPFEVL